MKMCIRDRFSCKLSVDPKLWDTKGGRVTGRSAAALETNRMLDKMRVRINRHYQEIMERDNFVTAEKVKNAFLGLEHRYHTLMQVFRRHNENYEKQVEAGMKAKGTLEKYRVVYKHLQEFLDIRYHVKDIALKELTPAFISDFEMFLRTDKHCCTNTVWLYVCPLRTMVFLSLIPIFMILCHASAWLGMELNSTPSISNNTAFRSMDSYP